MAELRRVATRRVCLSRAAAFHRSVREMLQFRGFERLAGFEGLHTESSESMIASQIQRVEL